MWGLAWVVDLSHWIGSLSAMERLPSKARLQLQCERAAQGGCTCERVRGVVGQGVEGWWVDVGRCEGAGRELSVPIVCWASSDYVRVARGRSGSADTRSVAWRWLRGEAKGLLTLSMPTSVEARAVVRTVGEAAAPAMSKVLQAGNGNRAAPRTERCGEATKGASAGGSAGRPVARRPADKAVAEECFMTDSCGSCGQILLWCKCAVSDLSLIQRTGQRTQPLAAVQSSTSAGTPISSVWSSEDDEKYGRADSERIGGQLLKWTRTSLDPHPTCMGDRTSSSSSLEGRELSVM